jgi:hypothetical protein
MNLVYSCEGVYYHEPAFGGGTLGSPLDLFNNRLVIEQILQETLWVSMLRILLLLSGYCLKIEGFKQPYSLVSVYRNIMYIFIPDYKKIVKGAVNDCQRPWEDRFSVEGPWFPLSPVRLPAAVLRT